MDKTVVELFAGVGGFRVGLERASKEYKTVWANQWEPSRKAQDAFNCYITRFGESDAHSNEDINEVDVETMPDHSLLVGGFPCQDYSVASTGAKGIQGKKGVLWWNIYEILKVKEAPFVLLENVDRLLKSPAKQRGRDFGIILWCLKELNYSVEWRVINAAEYGYAQRRRRVFIFAYKNDTKYGQSMRLKQAEELVVSEGFFQNMFPAHSTKKTSSLDDAIDFRYEDVMDLSDRFHAKFNNAGCLSGDVLYTEQLTPAELADEEKTLLGDIIEPSVDKKYNLDGELDKWRYMKGAKRIERTHRDGHKYIFAEGAIAFPDPLDRPSRTMLTSEASANRSTHIIQDPKTGKLRKITPVECERLNGFPDNWTDTGMSERFRYFCMGNALVVDLVVEMGKRLKDIIENE